MKEQLEMLLKLEAIDAQRAQLQALFNQHLVIATDISNRNIFWICRTVVAYDFIQKVFCVTVNRPFCNDHETVKVSDFMLYFDCFTRNGLRYTVQRVPLPSTGS